MKKYKAALFDFDGTMADTNSLVLESWQTVYRTLWGHEEEEEKILETFGEPLYDTVKRVFPELNPDEVVAIYRGHMNTIYEKRIEAFPGMIELMEELKRRGYLIGIVTSRMKGQTLIGLEKFGIAELVDSLITCEDTSIHKPNPEPALMCLDELGVEAAEALMVGDSILDIACAHNAGVDAALVSWTVTLKDKELKGADAPDYIIDEAADLLRILEG